MAEPDAKKPPPFWCPRCKQKHRADLSSLRERPGTQMRATCRGCGIALSVGLAADGNPTCSVAEETAAAGGPAPATVVAEAIPEDDGGARTPSTTAAPAAPAAPVAPVAPIRVPPAGATPVAKAPPTPIAKAAPTPASKPAPTPAAKSLATPVPRSMTAPVPKSASPATSRPLPPPRVAGAAIDDFAESERKAAEAPSADDLGRDARVGRYTIEDVIGRGGTGTVYRAFDPTTNRTVALKILNRGLPDSMRQRFLREIEVEANIRHQNIMPVFDRGELEDGRPFFTMELLYAPFTLTEVVDLREQGKLHRNASLRDLEDIKELVKALIIPVAEGIYVANVENGVVHRDLKPDNALIDSRTHRPYLIDFGICHVLEKREGLSSAVVTTSTEDAGIVGTPRFLSPEQARGSIHARTDVWGLGALLHFAISGEPPISGATPITRAELNRRVESLKEARDQALKAKDEKKAALCEEKLGRLTADGLRTLDDIFRDARDGRYTSLPANTAPPLAAIVRKAMAPVPADRYVNARQMAADLEAWLKGGRVRAVTDFGGTVAAVETARRAVKRHFVAGLWVALGLALGLVVGLLLGGGGARASAPDRLRLVQEDIERLKAESDQVGYLRAAAEKARGEGERTGLAEEWTPFAEHRIWRALDGRAAEIQRRLEAEAASGERDAVLARLAFVRARFAPRRVLIEAPAGTPLSASNADTTQLVTVQVGENPMPPGHYRIAVGPNKEVQVPVRVPLVIRTDQEDPAKEPALEAFSVPIPLASIPKDMVLVVGGTVRARDLPFAEPTTPTAVKPFLVDRREVTNQEYAQFLKDLPASEREARTPEVGFSAGAIPGEVAPSPEAETAPVVGLRPEDARAYAAWRAKRDGATVRLPSEAEWVLMAGGAQGWLLANGYRGGKVGSDLTPPLRPAGANTDDVSEYGVFGLFGNAREMVLSLYDDVPAGGVLVKGAGVGDEPDAAAVHIVRKMGPKDTDLKTGFRCVREITAP